MTGQDGSRDDSTIAAVMRLTDLAAKVERVEHTSTRRLDELARDCAAAMQQVTGLREELGTFGGRADGIEQRLAEVSTLLEHMSGQIEALTAPAAKEQDSGTGYQVNPRRRGGNPPTRGARTPRRGWSTGWRRSTGRCSATSPACWPRAGRSTRCAWPTWTPCTRRGACST